MKFRINYNSPAILSLALISTFVFILNSVLAGQLTPIFSLPPYFQYNSLTSYLSLVLYIFGSASIDHLLNNMMMILLIGPVLEEKYGTRLMILMILVTAVTTGFINILLFDTGLWGASGVLFMLIILISFTNIEKGKIPLTFILVLILYLGKEIVSSVQADQVSQFAHIFGGICGGVFGFIMNGKRFKPKSGGSEKQTLPDL